MNILIIEPSRLIQLSLERIFSPYASIIHITGSGQEAYTLFKSQPIDLICVSFYLNDMDGCEFIARIRKEQWGESIPILMLTSKKDREVIANTFRHGASELLNKENLESLEKYLHTFAAFSKQHAKVSGDILVIDSNRDQVETILDYFSQTKLRFIHFTSAEQAADMAKAAEFDMVITNIVLSGSMTGMSLIREIREINETMYRVPILALTDAASMSQKIEILRAGANDSIEKPIVLEELGIRVRNLLQQKKLFDTVEMQKRQLEEIAIRDNLTGLYNRHFLLNMIDNTLKEAFRHQYPVSLLVLDLDYFKKINDTYGHHSGDKVLKATADLLVNTFRGSDTPVRYGGEEFVIILPHCPLDDAYERSVVLGKKIMELCPEGINVTASIGISQTSEERETEFNELFQQADTALYEAKAAGRNCVKSGGVL